MTVIFLFACSGGAESFVEGHVQGTRQGKAISFDFRSGENEHGYVTSQSASVALFEAYSDTGSITNLKYDGDASELGAIAGQFRVSVPSIIYAGKHDLRLEIGVAEKLFLRPENGGTSTLDFTTVRWVGGTEERLVVSGTFDAHYIFPGEDYTITGAKFQFSARCNDSERSAGICGYPGEKLEGTDVAFLMNRAFVTTDCPDDLTAPYQAVEPSYDDKGKVKVNDIVFNCSARDKSDRSICYSERTGVSADGCTWRVSAVTDRLNQQLSIAAWADTGCAKDSCNAFR